jgi:hypothetical protein
MLTPILYFDVRISSLYTYMITVSAKGYRPRPAPLDSVGWEGGFSAS